MAGNNAAKDTERKFLLEFIELYKDLPALWKIKSKVYHDRIKKNMAYDLLLVKYNRMFPEATKEDLKKKINSLRTNYRRELKKCMNSEASTDYTYVPTLWYFQEMNFLRDQELSESAPSDSLHTYTIDIPDGYKVNEEQISETPSSLDEMESQPCRAPSYTNTRVSKKRIKIKQPVNLSYERLNVLKDEYHYWSMACAADLRKMERTQQIYAKKAIAEIIMEAQLGLLHRHSVKINEYTPTKSIVELGACVSQHCVNHNQTLSPSGYSKHTSPTYSNPSPSHKPDLTALAYTCTGQPIVGENDCKPSSIVTDPKESVQRLEGYSPTNNDLNK